MDKGYRKQFELIKRSILESYREGKCDLDGNSIVINGVPRAPFHEYCPSVSKTYVIRNGKLVEK